MSCKPLKIEKRNSCQEGFRGINSRCLIINEGLKKLIESGKAKIVETKDDVQIVVIKEETK